jgi:hypothetical protein
MDGIAHQTFARETPLSHTEEQLSRALGEAVVKIWGHLPNALQSRLFHEAAARQDVHMRPRLAAFLHGNHPRTAAARTARAMIEPDSLGG